MADEGLITVDTPGLTKAFGIQGGLNSPELLRTQDVHLEHEVGEYLSRAQTYWVQLSANVDTTSGAAVALSASFPSGGLRFGRYLLAVALQTTTAANLTGAIVAVNAAGTQAEFPGITAAQEIASYGLTNARTYGTSVLLVPDFSLVKLPLWMPPSSYVTLYVSSSAASGVYTLKALFGTTEELSQDTPRAPIGQLRARIKI